MTGKLLNGESIEISIEEKLKALDEMIEVYEKLPPVAMLQPITHYDLLSVLLLVKSLLSS